MAYWNAYEYDENKLNSFYSQIDNRNDIGYCLLCGAPQSQKGIGVECQKLMDKWAFHFVELDETAKEFASTLTLKKWIRYADIIRNEYVRLNLDEFGKPKRFKTQFKIDFFNSISRAERISKKQIEVMKKDIEYAVQSGQSKQEYLGKVNEVLYHLDKPFFDKLCKEFKEYLNEHPLFMQYCKICFSNAWIEHPYKDVYEKDVKYHNHELLSVY